jgi:DNA helicase IV
MAIAGAAGTGKTVLATHKAALEAEGGERTLLVCFNEPLASHLRSRLSDQAGIDVFSFHQLCEDVAREARLPLPPPNQRNSNYVENQLPNLFVSGLSSLPNRRYTALVVDEGQDFEDAWLESLELALADDENATFYVFYDNNQQVMNRASSYIRSMKAARRRLRTNFRNTRKIFEVASRFYAGDGVVSIGPVGEPIRIAEATDESAATTKLRESLGFLISQTGMRPERIAVLCGSRRKANEITAGGSIGSYSVTDAAHPVSGSVIVDSVRRFKGLEADVIILFMPDTYIDDAEMLYVATTRAKALLIVIGSAGAASILLPN